MSRSSSNADVNELVRRYILRQYRRECPDSHLATCPATVVEDAEATPARFYDTGVEGIEFTATLRCSHKTEDYEYGELGDLPDILKELDELS